MSHLFRIAHRHGRRVMTIGTFAEPGDPLFTLRPRYKTAGHDKMLYIDDLFINDEYIQYMDHNCDANTTIVDKIVCARKQLYPGEQLTLNHFVYKCMSLYRPDFFCRDCQQTMGCNDDCPR